MGGGRHRDDPVRGGSSASGATGSLGRSGVNRAPDSGPKGSLFGAGRRFRTLRRLGVGGMGVVWEVYDRERDLRLALKELRRFSPEGLLRFKNEFRSLRDVRHPNLVGLDELFESEGGWYFTMELVEGVDFRAHLFGGEPVVRTPELERGTAQGACGSESETELLPTEDASATRETPPLATPSARPSSAGPSSAGPDQPHASVLRLPHLVDERRLRDAARQLAEGIAALHRAGVVHRDLKPSNILVEPGGRVVLLDFGVAAQLQGRRDPDGLVVGTYRYMAPEQTLGRAVTPAADWYALGVLLYEALTGRHPFRGSKEQVARQKVLVEPPPPSVHVPSIPSDLEALCMALLVRRPGDRPSAAEVLSALGAPGPSASEPAQVRMGADPFVGRTRELGSLERAYDRAQSGRATTVLVEGQSGVGKTATVDELLRRLEQRSERPLVLRGRCHEREDVPYKAFDGPIDDLSQALALAPSHLTDHLATEDRASLVRLFPSLGAALPTEADALEALEASGGNALELRDRAFRALTTVLDRLARDRDLVVAIDDVQWADPDSLILLQRVTGEAAPPWLLLLTGRSGPETEAAVRHVRGGVERIGLGGLPPAEARDLVAALLSRLSGEAAARDVDRIIAESSGHPMFLDELVQQLASDATATSVSLDAALRGRMARLAPGAQRLVEAVVIAGAPVPHAAIARVGGVEPARYRHEVDGLRLARLVRTRGSRLHDSIEPYHDRVREALYDALPESRRRDLHLALAEALEAVGGVGADVLARHFERGGDAERGASYALEAADTAARMVAFDRAAELYRTALALGDFGPEERQRLLERLGGALQNAGRAREAAEVYADAAGRADGTAKLDLRRRSAEQLLMGGHVREGKEAASHVLAGVGMRLPPSSLRTLVSLLLNMARIHLSRLQWRRRGERSAERRMGDEAREMARVDMCWSVGAGLCMIDTVIGMFIASRGLLPSLRLGEPFRVGRAACTASVVGSTLGFEGLSRRLLDLSRDAADVNGTVLGQVYAEVAGVVNRFLVHQDWAEAEAGARRALAMWKQAGMGRGFEFDFTTQFYTWCLAMRGQLARVRREVGPLVESAADTGNRFLEVSLRVFHHLPYMAADAPEEGLREVRDAIDGWLDVDAFQLPHCWTILSERTLALYAGRTEETDRERADWRRLRRSVLWRVEFVRDQAEFLEARWRIAKALEAEREGQHSAARKELRRAHRLGRRLRRHRGPMTRLWGELVRACLHAAEGRHDRAAEALEPLVGGFEGGASMLHAACVRWRLGETVGGDRGEAMVRGADDWLRGQGIQRPERMVETMAPGWAR